MEIICPICAGSQVNTVEAHRHSSYGEPGRAGDVVFQYQCSPCRDAHRDNYYATRQPGSSYDVYTAPTFYIKFQAVAAYSDEVVSGAYKEVMLHKMDYDVCTACTTGDYVETVDSMCIYHRRKILFDGASSV